MAPNLAGREMTVSEANQLRDTLTYREREGNRHCLKGPDEKLKAGVMVNFMCQPD